MWQPVAVNWQRPPYSLRNVTEVGKIELFGSTGRRNDFYRHVSPKRFDCLMSGLLWGGAASFLPWTVLLISLMSACYSTCHVRRERFQKSSSYHNSGTAEWKRFNICLLFWLGAHYTSRDLRTISNCLSACARAHPFFTSRDWLCQSRPYLVCWMTSCLYANCTGWQKHWSARAHVRAPFSYLGIGWADRVHIWCAEWHHVHMKIEQIGKGIGLHVRACVPLFGILGSAGPIALILSTLNDTKFICRLHRSAKALICTCARAHPFFISGDRLGRKCLYQVCWMITCLYVEFTSRQRYWSARAHVRTPFSYLGIGWADSAHIWTLVCWMTPRI